MIENCTRISKTEDLFFFIFLNVEQIPWEKHKQHTSVC